MSAPIERRRRFSIFVTIFTLFFAVVVMTGAAITFGNFLQTQDAATEAAATTFDSTIQRISAERAAFFCAGQSACKSL